MQSVQCYAIYGNARKCIISSERFPPVGNGVQMVYKACLHHGMCMLQVHLHQMRILFLQQEVLPSPY